MLSRVSKSEQRVSRRLGKEETENICLSSSATSEATRNVDFIHIAHTVFACVRYPFYYGCVCMCSNCHSDLASLHTATADHI